MAKDTFMRAFGGERDDPDLALVRAMATGEVEALNRLYTRYGPGLLVYLVTSLDDHQLAEEVLQDVMLAAWRSAASFRGQSSVKTWLLAVARNKAINARTRRRGPQTQPLPPDLTTSQAGPEELLAQHQADTDLHAALDELPPEQRETLQLLFFQDLSPAEVAQVMRVAPGTVKSRLSRARANLRQLLKLREDETL